MAKMTALAKAERVLNILELLGIMAMLSAALVLEIGYQEIPCPLCLLQRAGLICAAVGLLMNIRFGLRPSHYSLVLIGALFTSFVALRQIALHVIPGTPAYGSPLLGWHLYTWSFVISMMIVTITTIMLGMDRQYQSHRSIELGWFSQILFFLMVVIVAVNLISAWNLCGLFECVEVPSRMTH